MSDTNPTAPEVVAAFTILRSLEDFRAFKSEKKPPFIMVPPRSYPVGAVIVGCPGGEDYEYIYPDEAAALSAAMSGEVSADDMRALLSDWWEEEWATGNEPEASFCSHASDYIRREMDPLATINRVLARHGWRRKIVYERIAEGSAK